MTHFAVTAVGADRPGIVAAVTRVFVDHGCNLEDSSMTILRGQFAMMLVVDAPAGVGAPELEAALAAPAAELDLVVTVRPATAPAGGAPDGGSWTVSVHGADHPGIVHGVASLLAERSVNIVDLSTRVVGEADRALYTMVLEVTLPPGADPRQLAGDLEAKAGELGVTCRLHPSEVDIL
ncbi:MAG: ACT domain-containing protein [Actinomycetota bacterium]|nr:ACT domain-containing protein [Actinomycetota bacterium]